jgi:endoglucanase
MGTLVLMDGSYELNVGGLLWYPGDSDDASLNPALNAAMLLTRYAQIATTQDKKTNYLVRPSPRSRKALLITPFQAFARSQLDYALGNNPMSGAPSTPEV